MTKTVVTRFAPSPTGYLHIGGARTALFNWLYAKHTGGKFLLRIEDTDRERSTEAATRAILEGLEWLGLHWDGDVVYQAQRSARHAEVARELLANGKAYNCYLTVAELDAMRTAIQAERDLARKDGRPPRGPQTIESPWRDRDPADAPSGVKPSIRLKTPRDGETVVDDVVQGRVVFQNSQLDDLIILRSDGTPVYNLAVVVDDHDMGVTHVVRGNDHLNNAARQTQIYRAMGWDVPVFAHVPLIHGEDGAKLSKRHGAQGVEEFRAMGYLPAALRNYLARLGWSHGDDEIFSTEQAIEWFEIRDINKSAARFDFKKLADLNGHYIRDATPAELMPRIREVLDSIDGGRQLADRFAAVGWDRLEAALPSLRERAKTIVDLIDGAAYLVASRPLALDEKASRQMDAQSRAVVAEVAGSLSGVDEWSPAVLEAAVRQLADAKGLKLGQVAQPLRAALTGRTVSPPVFDVMAVLGRAETMARLKDQAP
ncbi:MAG: glutamate--tRNA ligase [Hyphomicrobiaceae bacterium]|nr:glutamate--tRNA ligase [Hyphomicrobiaceae bacterium]